MDNEGRGEVREKCDEGRGVKEKGGSMGKWWKIGR